MPLEFPFADSKTVVTAPAVVLLHEVIAASGPFSSDKCIENIETVQAGVIWQRGAYHRRKACSEIDGADHAVRDSRANGSRPPGDQWRPCPTFQDAVFPAAEGTGWFVFPKFWDGSVLVAVVENRTVVGTEYDQRRRIEIEAFEGCHQLADAPIELEYGVAAKSQTAFSVESLVGHSWHVKVMRRKEQEKRFVSMGFDPGD